MVIPPPLQGLPTAWGFHDRKTMKKKIKKFHKTRGPRPYKKCIGLIVQMAEDIIDVGDCPDELLDRIANLKKCLNPREQEVVSRLASVAVGPKIIEIDESTPGNELQFKI